jgi:hypothetical protein
MVKVPFGRLEIFQYNFHIHSLFLKKSFLKRTNPIKLCLSVILSALCKTTFSITALSIMALSIMALSIIALSIIAFSIMAFSTIINKMRQSA